MASTSIRGKQIQDGTVQRVDLDTTTVGQAVVAKLIQGTNVTLSSTGGDAGTGDVTINVPSATPTAHASTHVTGGSDIIALATSSSRGLLAQLSGVSTDYVGGDNACHALPITLGGRLAYVSATQLSFAPFNGSFIKINGLFYAIPSGGITGLANTNVYVNGTASQNLAASTIYRVYCFNNAGTLTADFSTTAHTTSSTAGNVGTEIKSGDDTRTLIGLIYTNASSQFADAPTTRYVRSWVNRKRINFSASASGTTGSTTFVTLATGAFVSFGDESISMGLAGYQNINAIGTSQSQILFDGAAVIANFNTCPTSGYYQALALTYQGPDNSEGRHQADLQMLTNTGTLTYSLSLSGTAG